MNRRLALAIPTALLIGVAAGFAGCESIGWVTSGLAGPGKVKAVHRLIDRPTLVLVDDPHKHLDDPSLAGVVASNVAFGLKQNLAISADIVPPQQLGALAAELGKDFALTPIDEIGRRLDAGQVIYILIQQVRLQFSPGMYRPMAVVQVKVMDCEAATRLFPKPASIPDPTTPSPGYTIAVQMTHRDMGIASRGMNAIIARQLAESIGRDVSRLFYDWKKPEPGSKFD